MMGSDLRNILKRVCTNTSWKYAIFWKLKSLPTPVLTWEDAYYEKSMSIDSLGYGLCDGSVREHSQNDQLGFCVAKMSSQDYSLGEGIVGKAAATGDYQWIHAKSLQKNSSHFIELSNCLLGQISAGIRTVVVVGIAQFAVVQLGSLQTVDEDVKFVSLVRELILSLYVSEYGRTLHNSCVPMGRDHLANIFNKPVPLFPEFCDKRKICRTSFDLYNPHNQVNLDLVNKNIESVPKCATEKNFKEVQQSLHSNTMISCYVPNSSTTIDVEDSHDNLRMVESWSPTPDVKISAKDLVSSSIIANSIDYEENSLTIFSGGYELHEALGPAFMKRYVLGSEQREAESEAAVSNACQSDALSVSPVLPEHSCREGTKVIAINSCVKDDMQEWSNSTEACGASTFSSHSEAVKSKKRTRCGENCRQRPRDRQLIQDRIKELREIVPNGSKCSIDSLLERTINHMLFLESITNHAEKMKKVTNGRSCEQESSWAVEVGGLFKVSSVVVENLNKSGQMMVEMVCEECTHFLEISQLIRSVGLTILKGVSEGKGGKICLSFVVEGQGNQTVHRIDVLCSLLQALQSKASH